MEIVSTQARHDYRVVDIAAVSGRCHLDIWSYMSYLFRIIYYPSLLLPDLKHV